MFQPSYTITTTLLANIKRISLLWEKLNNKSYPAIVKAKLERSAREISVYASTSIEGNPLPLTEVKSILKNHPLHLRDSEREILNYNKALEFADKFILQNIQIGLPTILKLHKLVEDNLLETYRCGKLRMEPVFVNDPKTGKPVYLPPDHKDVLALMNELIDFVSINKDKIDPLILAGIFHKQMVIIHPFIDGNGRTTRVVTKILLAILGINTFRLFSFENYYNSNVTKYFAKVGEFGNYYEIHERVNFTQWLEYFTDGIIDELLRVDKEFTVQALTPDNELKKQHILIMKHIKDNGYITDKQYAEITDRAKPTRHLDFRKLISLGLIKSEGKGKATFYTLV